MAGGDAAVLRPEDAGVEFEDLSVHRLSLVEPALNTVFAVANGCYSLSPDGGESFIGDREPTYRGEFWVYAEPEGDGVRSVSLELLGVARRLAASLHEIGRAHV